MAYLKPKIIYVTPETPICPTCNNDAELVNGYTLGYTGGDSPSKMFWHCAPCGTRVGCHEHGVTVRHDKTGERFIYYRSDGTWPLGHLASPNMRGMRQRTHFAFDTLWKSGKYDRNEAYDLLAEHLGITREQCHIGLLSIGQCWEAIRFANTLMAFEPVPLSKPKIKMKFKN